MKPTRPVLAPTVSWLVSVVGPKKQGGAGAQGQRGAGAQGRRGGWAALPPGYLSGRRQRHESGLSALRPRAPAIARGTLTAITILIAVAGGCVTKQTVTRRTVTVTASPENALDRLLNPDHGLLLHTWVVADNTERIAAALMRYQDGTFLEPAQENRLRRNGLRLLRVRTNHLADLLGELAVGPSEVDAWHGQVLQWRELHHRSLVGPGTALAVSGRVRSVSPGRLRIMGRCWTVLMENGPYLSLQLLPQLIGEQSPSLYQLLGDSDLRGEVFRRLAIEIELRPGYACILTGEAPAISWTNHTEPSSEHLDATAAGTAVGPETETPDTLGEFLFSSRAEPPLRTLLVFVPRIPDRLLHPYRVGGIASEGQSVAVTR